jgi:uncharacterized protein (TIGR00251 family)
MIAGLRLFRRGDRLCFSVHLQPRASRNEVAGFTGEALKVRLTSPPVDDRANRQLREFLAQLLAAPVSNVEIVQGHKSRNKTVAVKGVSQAVLMEKLGALGLE